MNLFGMGLEIKNLESITNSRFLADLTDKLSNSLRMLSSVNQIVTK